MTFSVTFLNKLTDSQDNAVSFTPLTTSNCAQKLIVPPLHTFNNSTCPTVNNITIDTTVSKNYNMFCVSTSIICSTLILFTFYRINQFRLESCPRPRWGAYNTSQAHLSSGYPSLFHTPLMSLVSRSRCQRSCTGPPTFQMVPLPLSVQ